EDKALLPAVPLLRNDEVSALAREFHRMATALLERERTVETQKDRLQESNRRLREMGALNGNILSSIQSILIVTDLEGRVTQCNPVAARWLGAAVESVLASQVASWQRLTGIPGVVEWLSRLGSLPESVKIEPAAMEGRVY